jgi:serine/threonine protein kinase
LITSPPGQDSEGVKKRLSFGESIDGNLATPRSASNMFFGSESSSVGNRSTPDSNGGDSEFSETKAKYRGEIWIVTEYCDKGTVEEYFIGPNPEKDELMEQKKEILVQNVKRWVLTFAEALWMIHEMDIVHRDLKPENLFLKTIRGRTEIKIGDFGSSCTIGEDINSSVDGEGNNIGSRCFGSPELLSGRPHGRSTDAYSFGVIVIRIVYFDQCIEEFLGMLRRMKDIPYGIDTSSRRRMDLAIAKARLQRPIRQPLQSHPQNCVRGSRTSPNNENCVQST